MKDLWPELLVIAVIFFIAVSSIHLLHDGWHQSEDFDCLENNPTN